MLEYTVLTFFAILIAGECRKAAKILNSFIGMLAPSCLVILFKVVRQRGPYGLLLFSFFALPNLNRPCRGEGTTLFKHFAFNPTELVFDLIFFKYRDQTRLFLPTSCKKLRDLLYLQSLKPVSCFPVELAQDWWLQGMSF